MVKYLRLVIFLSFISINLCAMGIQENSVTYAIKKSDTLTTQLAIGLGADTQLTINVANLVKKNGTNQTTDKVSADNIYLGYVVKVRNQDETLSDVGYSYSGTVSPFFLRIYKDTSSSGTSYPIAMPQGNNGQTNYLAENINLKHYEIGGNRDQAIGTARLNKFDISTVAKDHPGSKVTFLLAVKKQDGSFEVFRSEMTIEFFPGEKAIMEKMAANLSYAAKAKRILYYWFTSCLGGDTGRPGTAINSVIPASDRLVGSSEAEQLIRDNSRRISGAIKRYLYDRNMKVQYPYLGASQPGTFLPVQSFWGEKYELYHENVNPYALLYLKICFALDKPLYSYDLKKQDSTYDHTFYKTLAPNSPISGQIVQAAWRYLTWGIGPFKYDASAVLKNMVDASGFKKWMRIDSGANGSKLTNYYAGSIATLDLNTYLTNFLMTKILASSQDKQSFRDSILNSPYAGANPPYTINCFLKNSYKSLPYSKFGIDSPRTYNWKAIVRNDAFWQALKITDTNDQNWYRFEEQQQAKIEERNVGNYAGVDSLGLLSGCLAQTEIDLRNIKGDNVLAELDKYYRMLPGAGNLMGELDGNGYPKWTTNENANNRKAGKYRLTEADLEKISIVVPDIDQIQLGDIIVYYGNQNVLEPERDKYVDIGIVVGKNSNFSQAATVAEKMQRITVINVKEGAGSKVMLGTWGIYAGIYNNCTVTPERYHIRRLLNKTATNAPITNTRWDCTGDIVEELVLDLDLTSIGNAANGWDCFGRFVPNTGEYFHIKRIKLRDINDSLSNNTRIVPIAPLDRGYPLNADGTENTDLANQGNIYKNKGAGLELAVLKKNGTWKPLAKFSYAASPTTGSDLRSHYTVDILEPNGYFFVRDDMVYFHDVDNVEGLSFGVRPLHTDGDKHPMPGDDYLIGFGLVDQPDCFTHAAEDDYVAVYDKKLLWRANLYIAEQNNDWNDLHPWNVPPEGSIRVIDPKDGKNKPAFEVSPWWSWEWGYNDWNRGYNGITFAAGQGGQTLSFTAWTPLRTKTVVNNEKQYGNNNRWNDRVAYDYMYPDNVGTTIRAWDSPFEFIKKMNTQKMAIQTHFGNIATANNGVDADQNGDFTPISTDALPDGTNILSNSALGTWENTWAPYNRWKFYWKEPATTVPPNANTAAITYYGHIPGLGLYLVHPNTDNDEENLPGSAIFNNSASAGTDCIGFVQRTASYRDNSYIWNNLPFDRAEGNNEPDGPSRTSLSEGTHFPNNDNSSIIIDRASISRVPTFFTNNAGTPGGPSLDSFNSNKRKLQLVIPGDIIQYEGHIGVICDINRDAIVSAYNYKDIFAGIEIIESVYNQRLSFVFKRNMMMGNGDAFEEGAVGSWHLNNDNLLRQWSIRRLEAQ